MLPTRRTGLLSCALIALTITAVSSAASAQNVSRVQPQKKRWPRLVSLREGSAILDAAWEHRDLILDDYKPDCSHLVHEIYSLVGLGYKYAPSRELYYNRVTEFTRVLKPQAGDLIVWLGHVGMVVDPLDHSFYSSLKSGLLTDSYLKQYWRRRGTPRFYRYRLGDRMQRIRFDFSHSLISRNRGENTASIISPFADVE